MDWAAVRRTKENFVTVSIVPVKYSLKKMAGIGEVIQAVALALVVAYSEAIVEDNQRNQGLESARNSHFKHTVVQTTMFEYSSKTTNFLAFIIAGFKHGVQVSSKPSSITI